MIIQSKINDLILNDEYFGNSKECKETYVDSETISVGVFLLNLTNIAL